MEAGGVQEVTEFLMVGAENEQNCYCIGVRTVDSDGVLVWDGGQTVICAKHWFCCHIMVLLANSINSEPKSSDSGHVTPCYST